MALLAVHVTYIRRPDADAVQRPVGVDRRDLRAEAEKIDGRGCVWPNCRTVGEQLAHLRGVGAGGRPSADTLSNVALLCRFHHDLLDGRSHAGLRVAVGDLLAGYVALSRRNTGANL